VLFIYVEVPKGYEFNDGEENETYVLKLERSLYGLVQAPLYWGNHLKDTLEKHGLKQSASDPCMYIGDGVICLTYVDDCLFFGKDAAKIDSKIKSIQDSGLKLTIEDDIFAFLGVELHRKDSGEVELRQRGLIDKILLTCGMKDCNTKSTPCNQVPLGSNPDGDPVTGKFDYASAVGMLMYLSSNSRPDIQYAVHQCARFTHFPKKTHEDAILRICRYLQGTKDKGLIFNPTEDLTLDCYVDADFVGLYGVEDDQDPVCVKSRTGYCLTLGGCPLIWVSKLQTEIALSTTEAEYIALSQSLRDVIPMRRLLKEASEGLSLTVKPTAKMYSTVFEDNNGALSIAQSPRMSPRTKHIAIKYHHFRNSIGEDKGIVLEKIDTTKQKADILTKGLPSDTHVSIRKLMMGW
jgi:Reverse transcriptase (RNA-dependent DNA polymerase)